MRNIFVIVIVLLPSAQSVNPLICARTICTQNPCEERYLSLCKNCGVEESWSGGCYIPVVEKAVDTCGWPFPLTLVEGQEVTSSLSSSSTAFDMKF